MKRMQGALLWNIQHKTHIGTSNSNATLKRYQFWIRRVWLGTGLVKLEPLAGCNEVLGLTGEKSPHFLSWYLLSVGQEEEI